MFFTKIIAIVIAVTCPAFAHHEDNIGFRITNGVLATEPKGFPYVVAVEDKNKWACGAVLVSPNMVLTTGLCTRNLTPETLTVRAGSFVREDRKGQHVQVRKVTKITMHPRYQAKGFHDNDASLLHLDSNFELTDYVNIIKLADKDFTNQNALILGWGKDAHFSDNSNLLTAKISIISNQECDRAYKGKETITDSIACAISSHDQVVCRDSGSPVVIHYPENPKQDILIGLASHSEILKIYKVPIQGGPPVLVEQTCDTKKPSIFTRITAVEDWISGNL